jgi:hypothetical protein
MCAASPETATICTGRVGEPQTAPEPPTKLTRSHPIPCLSIKAGEPTDTLKGVALVTAQPAR